MADAEKVMVQIDREADVRVAGLALHMKGIERARVAGVDEVRYVDELRAYVGDRAPPQLHVLQGLNTDSGNV